MARKRSTENPWIRLAIGIWVLAAGVVLWLDRVGRIDAADYTMWWPAAVITVGLAHLPRRQWVGGAIWITIGLYLLLPLMNLPQLPLWKFFTIWPLLITVAGVTLLMNALQPPANAGARGAGTFTSAAVMAGDVRRIGSANFVGGYAVAVMGGCDIDLTGARINGEATIDVIAFWGGIELTVPREWDVVVKVAGVLGGATDSTAPAPAGAPRLTIRGSAIMGGVEVKNAVEEKA